MSKKKTKRRYQKVDYAPANFLRRLRHDSFQKRRNIIKIALATLIVIVFTQLMVGPFGTLELIRMYQKKELLEERIHRLTTELANLEWEARRLDSPDYIEKIARERYYMLRPGEIIIKLPPQLLLQDEPS